MAGQHKAGELGVSTLVSIGIGGMVGGGIFSVLGLTVQIAGAGAYLSFVVGGLIAALTGRSDALLSVRIRSRGGTAFFLDRCFGTTIAGPLNVLLWLSYFVMLGLYAVAFGSYGAALLGADPDGPWRRVLASGVVLAFAGLNLAGARIVGRAEALLVYGKLAILLVFCIAGMAFVDGERVSPAHYPAIGVIVYAGALIFLGYEGFELIANAAEDARDPRRSLPLAYLISIAVVIGLYVLVAFVAVGNLDVAQIDRDRDYALAAAARPFLGSAGFVLIGIAAVISTASADQCHPVWHRKIHLPDGTPRRAATRSGQASVGPAERWAAGDHRRHAGGGERRRHRGHQPHGVGWIPAHLRRSQPRRFAIAPRG